MSEMKGVFVILSKKGVVLGIGETAIKAWQMAGSYCHRPTRYALEKELGAHLVEGELQLP